jgi:hypothetical protein
MTEHSPVVRSLKIRRREKKSGDLIGFDAPRPFEAAVIKLSLRQWLTIGACK